MLIERNGVFGVECDGRFIPAIRGGYGTETLLIAAIVIAVASAAVTYVQQSEAAERQAKYQRDLVKAQDEAIAQNAALANEAYMRKTKQLQERQRQEDEARFLNEQQVATEAAQARATAKVAAGEAGVAGLSVSALIDDFTAQEARYRYASAISRQYGHDQTQAELEGLRYEAEGRIATMKPYQPQPVQFPSLAGAALRAGSDSLAAYRMYSGSGSRFPTTNTVGLNRSDMGFGNNSFT